MIFPPYLTHENLKDCVNKNSRNFLQQYRGIWRSEMSTMKYKLWKLNRTQTEFIVVFTAEISRLEKMCGKLSDSDKLLLSHLDLFLDASM